MIFAGAFVVVVGEVVAEVQWLEFVVKVVDLLEQEAMWTTTHCAGQVLR